MNGCKGCVGESFLGMGFLVAMAAFVTWSMTTPGGLGQGVYVGAMGVTFVCLVVVAIMIQRAQKGVIEAGNVAEQHSGDPIAPVTRTAGSGCGMGLAMLAMLAVLATAGVLVWILSMVGGA